MLFSNLVELIENQLANQNYSTIICDTSNNQVKERKSIDMLNARLVDGIIVISGRTKFQSESLNYSVPLVYIDREAQNDTDYYFIGSDHYKGAALATNKLISAHTKPFLFKNEKEYPSIKERIKGYVDTYKNNLTLLMQTEFWLFRKGQVYRRKGQLFVRVYVGFSPGILRQLEYLRPMIH
ncbi:hypothetical protein SDC49_04250 [Lactobacillus sp. R2/2]|nr:hypothetical protein [Lactobacillus sp. R2/2]